MTTGESDRDAGDYGFDPIGWMSNKDFETQQRIRLQELKNGRLAMIGMAGFAANHMIPGAVPFLQLVGMK